MIKLIAIDLDDTLLTDDLSLTRDNITTLKAAYNKGIYVVLCSGRPYNGMLTYIDKLAFHTAQDPIISFNGALVGNVLGDIYFKRVVKKEDLETLIPFGRKYAIDIQLYDDTTFIIEKKSNYTQSYERLSGLKPIYVNDLSIVDESVKVLFNYASGEKLESLRQDLVNYYGDKLNIFYSKPNYVEVLNPEANKGLALKFLAEKLKIDPCEVMAIGDSFNDMSMLTFAGTSIAVGNARSEIKKIATYVTTATNNNSAVAEAINKFILFPGE